MRKVLLLSLGILIAAVAVWWWWALSAEGFSATAKPTWIEARLAGLTRRLALPSGEASLHNPYPATPARLAAAQSLWQAQCAQCHNGNGDGQTELGQSLYPKPPDLRGLTQNKSDGAMFYSIRNGIRLSGMPAWRQDSDEEIWNLVSLIRSLKQQ